MSDELARSHDFGDQPLQDARVLALLDRYVALSGATLTAFAPGLLQLSVPASDRSAFGRRSAIRLALSAEALAEDEHAELAIVGSAFVNQLITAVRRRGSRLHMGWVGDATASVGTSVPVAAPIRSGRVVTQEVRHARHRIGRLTARVVVRAGAEVRELLVESDLFDLSTGATLGSDVVQDCERVAGQPTAERPEYGTALDEVAVRDHGELVGRMLGSLETRLQPEIKKQAATTQHALERELSRIQRYYGSMLAEVDDADGRRALEAEHKRREKEETERHRVRAIVHPIQLAEWEVAVERVEWHIEANNGHHAVFTAQRVLAGDRQWLLACPTCAEVPKGLSVCRNDHACCIACGRDCSVCGETFCRDHGLAACHVDKRPACLAHSRTCTSCRRKHCSTHEGRCGESDHPSCTACLAPCAHCHRMICDKHATLTHKESTRGQRRLCSQCVRHCEGGSREVVAPDEVTGCASCKRVVCDRHRARCDVDGLVHCSTHLRRVDRSRRFVCEKHRAACTYEPNAVLASDEVVSCATCGGTACAEHTGVCAIDRTVHCTVHLAEVRDRNGQRACAAHRTTCHVDGGAFTQEGTSSCPACGRLHCETHSRRCSNCGRRVCTSDFHPSSPATCATCNKLIEATDISNQVLAAVDEARGGDDGRVKGWRTSRDARHVIVQLDLGWTRRLVVAVPHGGGEPEAIVKHSIFGSTKIKG